MSDVFQPLRTSLRGGVGLLILGLTALAIVLMALVLGSKLPLLFRVPSSDYDPERMVLVYATLPRLVMAVLCGMALGASGALLQQALRNPLASPSTLGIDAGARLALGITTLVVPALFGWGRDVVALVGAGLATMLVFALSRRQDFSPLSLVLSGLLVSLYCGALTAALTLIESRYLASLFVWGSGSLSQQSWTPSIDLAIRLVVVAPLALLLVRPLALLDVGEDAARGLGLHVSQLRLLAVALAALLAAFTSSAVGVIAFIGLVAPLIVRLSGVSSFAGRLAGATVIGGLLLLVTDLLLQTLTGFYADLLPTGAVTALLGSPILLWLLPRVTAASRPVQPSALMARRRMSDRKLSLLLPLSLVGLVVLLVIMALFLQRAPDGAWQVLASTQVTDVLPYRWPRVLATAVAGLLLGTAGFLLQRLTGNEMASPEILGVSAGATFAMAIALVIGLAPTPAILTTAAAIGAAVILGFILLLARRSGFQPERMLLAGVALSALLDAVIGFLSSAGDPRAFQLLAWLTGAGSSFEPQSVAIAFVLAGLAIGGALCLTRWLSILPLGATAAIGLGVPIAGVRILLIALAVLATAGATPLAGPLTFTGLIAPHLVRYLGVTDVAAGLTSSALAGAAILIAADWAARMIAFPFQLPTGLVACLIGAPILLWLLQKRTA
ncbi:Fe(3+)-hydroxamate ABC transporter permease FhuB [Microvirga lotononidis]|uniref:ABC-type Fe3+-siderophore transport system, permease component n=1 Tax=Microvirga lotononidis TaxID=864069 RepID=I4Z1T5_9HYPH|nr:Fe(3+)-hydroxamate ABC transporter permease FhuB [Microvirga lotononidis]EIM30177.1 ABC-type Fe3+-siderophore transport system, permease component [Microvirga lotononidis]WQO31597.1 Fe(3+)-hydroxamate ABC transporter permease FhuB [Microvirga lotononidis]